MRNRIGFLLPAFKVAQINYSGWDMGSLPLLSFRRHCKLMLLRPFRMGNQGNCDFWLCCGGYSAKKSGRATAASQERYTLRPAHDEGLQGIQVFRFDGPSPDDCAGTPKGDKKGTRDRPASAALTAPAAAPVVEEPSSSGADDVTQGMGELSISDTKLQEGSQHSRGGDSQKQHTRAWSEYVLDPNTARLVQESSAEESSGNGAKTKLHLVVLGHVDAGKSTLMGRLLHDLGYVGQKQVHKNEKDSAQIGKASFSWAWVLDERPEERARGVTVDVAMSRFQTSKYIVTLMDAPGHRDFVPHMIGGASQADAALLLVDGSIGGFEAGFQASGPGLRGTGGGQTREHAQLARSLGIEQVAVVISKLDSCDFSQDRFESVKAQLIPFLKQCGFKERNIQWLLAAAPLGINMTERPSKDNTLLAWFQGPSVVESIDNFMPIRRIVDAPLRVPIADVFKSRTLGSTAVGGKVECGAMAVGGKVLVMPAGEVATIKSLEVDGQKCPLARAGDSCDVGLSGIEESSLFPGSVLCPVDWPTGVSSKFELCVVVLEPPIPIIPGTAVELHAHTAREEGHIARLLTTLDPKAGGVAKTNPRRLAKGETATVVVTAKRGMCLEQYATCRALGRVAVRQGGRTIAVGIVTKVEG
ncbi:unnamed protein product [Ostreobium quekettii]|uniref:Tr-type G domain-containing protein n=1 Tax=Ostreobium quekettii TaxID=121088 RepID=A0A8S1IWL1_9CHLO|nr:unnamed protein product [Ostreobium quekettii]